MGLIALASAHHAIPNLRPAGALWLSFNISLYVLLTKWNEQTHCPNMLHHTERVGLSCRINKGGLAAGVEDAQLSGGYICLLLQQSTRI